MKKTVKDLALLLDKAEIFGDENRCIGEIVHDSRKIGSDFLFVCIPGVRTDGHNFIEEAVKNGAVAVLVERDVAAPEGVSVIKVPDVRAAMQAIVPYFYDYPSRKMRVIGVTGTNGKTTVTYLLRSILQSAGYKVGLIGTIQIMIEDDVLPINNTTPDVIDLQGILFEMAERGMDYVVMEVSSHALAQNRVAGLEFDTAVFTNLTQDHLDYHKTLDNYAKAKARLFSLVSEEGAKAGKAAVVNIDDAYSSLMFQQANCRTLSYGIVKNGGLRAEDIVLRPAGAEFTVDAGAAGKIGLRLKITGMFNVYNVLAAVGAALAEQLRLDVIKGALEKVTGVPGRFELVDAGQDFAVIVDYAHTPDGLQNVLETAKAITVGRIITVFGCGGDRDQKKRPIMGRIAAEFSDVVVLTSDNPRTEDPMFILSQVEEGIFVKIGKKRHEKIADRKEAIYRAIGLAKPGDTVVIAGKGHENYQILKDEVIHFDDKEVACMAIGES